MEGVWLVCQAHCTLLAAAAAAPASLSAADMLLGGAAFVAGGRALAMRSKAQRERREQEQAAAMSNVPRHRFHVMACISEPLIHCPAMAQRPRPTATKDERVEQI